MNEFNPSQTESAGEEMEAAGADMFPELNDEGEIGIVAAVPKPRNNLIMLLTALMVFGGGGLLFMRMKAGPKPAVANSETTTAKATINEFLNDGGKNLNSMRELLRNTERLVQTFLSYPRMNQIKLDELKTNPFRFKRTVSNDPSLSAETAEKRKQAEKEAIVKAAGQLHIQSTLVSGAAATCMVNNRMYTEGQEVDSFVIEKINPDGIIVKRGGYRFELKMKR